MHPCSYYNAIQYITIPNRITDGGYDAGGFSSAVNTDACSPTAAARAAGPEGAEGISVVMASEDEEEEEAAAVESLVRDFEFERERTGAVGTGGTICIAGTNGAAGGGIPVAFKVSIDGSVIGFSDRAVAAAAEKVWDDNDKSKELDDLTGTVEILPKDDGSPPLELRRGTETVIGGMFIATAVL
jgi:hypothetical protein